MAYQIIHSFEKFINRFDYTGDFSNTLEKCLIELMKLNIDGIVININTENGYLENEENWAQFIMGMRVAISLGLKIWIYDEKGYPSGGAGGLVLRDHPELEAKGIKFHNGDYYIATIYEGSHAERNFREKRRYINLLESKAVTQFAISTYYKYKEKLPSEIFDEAEAFFTDEPSLMTVVTNILDGSDGNLELASVYPDRVIPVNDKPDSSVPITPSIPYSWELNETYFKSYGNNLLDIAPGIFQNSETPQEEKCRFWESVAITYEKAYGKTLSGICEQLNKKLTGHLLFEETPILNMAFHSNPMRILKHFQLPGIDLLSNIQSKISVFAHKMVASSAWQKGLNGIMTETSDFDEYRQGPKKPTAYNKIIAALYKQFALGVREFSFYYDFNIRKDKYGKIAGTIKNLCDYASYFRFKPDCAVYCSYETVWAGYYPSTAKPAELHDAQPEFVKCFEDSLLNICEDFYHKNIQFVLMDESSINEIIAKGITQVIIPECTVISNKLIEYAEEGKIGVYGYTPEYLYLDGSLEKNKFTKVSSVGDIVVSEFPFACDGDSILTAFEGGRYFCFNPHENSVRFKLNKACKVYDPYKDKQTIVPAGKGIVLQEDSAVVIEETGE